MRFMSIKKAVIVLMCLRVGFIVFVAIIVGALLTVIIK